MRVRRTSRIILLDDNNRILLFKVEEKRVIRPGMVVPTPFWITPGGAVEAGETDEDAARRELWEETGIIDFKLGPLVAQGKPLLEVGDELVQAMDNYFLVKSSARAVSIENMIEAERNVYRDHRWWSIEELRETDEVIYPLDLAELLSSFVFSGIPTTPIQLQKE